MDILLITSSPHSTIVLNDVGDIQSLHGSMNSEIYLEVKDSQVITDNIRVHDLLREQRIDVRLDLHHKILRDWRINRYEKLLAQTGAVTNFRVYYSTLRDAAILSTRTEVKKNSAKSDEIVAQIIHAIDDLQKSVNLSSNRLSELYALHFPEMVDLVNNTITLARIIIEVAERAKIDATILSKYGIPKGKIEMLLNFTNDSLGGELGSDELFPLQEYAFSLVTMYEKMKSLEDWVEKSMSSIAPNLTAVAGPNVGARLISAMGSLRALAMKSSSKVQIIGAERALYSALRSRGSPPKHGIIYQIPEIGNSPYWVRGKIARAFASKIVIAARIDYFEGDFIGDTMRDELREFEVIVRKKFPNPPPPKEQSISSSVRKKHHSKGKRTDEKRKKGNKPRRNKR